LVLTILKKFSLPGFRAATLDDLKQVHALLEKELKQFDIHQNFSEEEVKHYFFTQPEPVHTYVVEDAQEEKMVAFISFYTLPNTILHNSKYDGMKSAYLWYYAAENDAILKNLVKDALVAARDLGHDVFNALEMMRNKTFLNELKFALGDGTLNFYLFNWRCPAVSSEKQAFVVI
jgi:glycylpeptide N-tetradecanoyltransferase